MRHMTRTTSYLLRSLVLLMLAALAASVVAVVLASPPVQAANLTVTTAADEDNPNTQCSLREAIINANQNSNSASADCAAGVGEDTINFNLGSPATITLVGQLPNITDSAGLIIDGGGANITVSGNNTVRVFEVGTSTISGAKLTLNNLTVANGRALLGAGILNNSSNTLMVNNSTLSGNNANTQSQSGGGGIWNYNSATLTVSNSTLSGNSARMAGGGIHNNGGTLTVSNSTLSGNSTTESFGDGGGISSNGGAVTLKNTIVANSPSGRNCSQTPGAPITNGGYNLDSDGSCGFGTTNNSLSGTTDNPLDPQLGTLNDNGGPTKTHALLEGSPAIGKGNNAFAIDANGNALQFDQRGEGFARIVGARVDIGAFEVQSLPDTTAPRVTSTVPGSNIGGVAPTINVKATFSEHDPGEEGMMASSITGQTFKLFKKGSTTKIGAAVTYSASTDTATLNPTNNLNRGVTYKAVVTTGAKDLAGNRLDQNSTPTDGLQQKAWTFTVKN
jgi:CSLREA domain-containing protein